MNGFELAGRAIKVGHITERTNDQANPNAAMHGGLEYEENGRSGNFVNFLFLPIPKCTNSE